VSEVNYLGINENFPVPGEDNDTQVFRDNFDTIKQSLRIAKEEITDLQDNVARTDLDNDFNNKVIQRAVMLNNINKKFDANSTNDPGELPSSITIDYENGNYQIWRFAKDTNIEFQNFPDDTSVVGGVGKVTLELYGDGTARTITFVTTGGTVLKRSPNWPSATNNITVVEQEGAGGLGDPIIVEIWRHRSDKIMLNYLGEFTTAA
jgi:hypothetical protein